MTFACVDAFLTLPFNISILIISTRPPLPFYPYRGLTDLHYNFSAVGQWPTSTYAFTTVYATQAFIIPGTAVGSSFIFFAFFGLNKDARANYYKAYATVRDRCSRCIRELRARATGTPKQVSFKIYQ